MARGHDPTITTIDLSEHVEVVGGTTIELYTIVIASKNRLDRLG